MADEFRDAGREINPQVENKTVVENVVAKENVPVLENKEAKENIEYSEKAADFKAKAAKKKQTQALSVLSGGLAATVGLVLIGVTNLVNVRMKAEFADVTYQDGQITYSINVEQMTEKENLTLYPSLDKFELDPIELVDEDDDGIIKGIINVDKKYIEEKLNSNDNVLVEYVLDLKGVVGLDVERAFDSYVVQIEKFTSVFNGVDCWCNCGVDGYYYFQLDFVDDHQMFTNFEAWIVDDFGNRSDCVFSDNLHEAQKIFVLDLQGSHGTLFIKYNADGIETYVGNNDPTVSSNGIEINM